MKEHDDFKPPITESNDRELSSEVSRLMSRYILFLDEEDLEKLKLFYLELNLESTIFKEIKTEVFFINYSFLKGITRADARDFKRKFEC